MLKICTYTSASTLRILWPASASTKRYIYNSYSTLPLLGSDYWTTCGRRKHCIHQSALHQISNLMQSQIGYALSMQWTVPTLYVDNQAAFEACKNPVHHGRMRHLMRIVHFIQDLLRNKTSEHIRALRRFCRIVWLLEENVRHAGECYISGFDVQLWLQPTLQRVTNSRSTASVMRSISIH